MSKIGIMCDTTSTINPDFIKKHNIHLLHNSVCDVDGNMMEDDCSDQQKLVICQQIKKEFKIFKTSLVNVTKVIDAASEMLKTYDQVVYLTLNTGYSAQYEQTKEAAKELKGKFIVINSLSIASHAEIVLEWLVDYIENLGSKKFDEDFVNEHIKEMFNHITTMYSTPNYEGLVASGRMPKAIGLTLKLTKTFPIIIAEEINKRGGFFRKWAEVEKNVFGGVDKKFNKPPRGKDIKEMIIVSSLCSNEKLDELKESISSYFEIKKEMIKVRITPLVVIVATLLDSWGICIYTNDDVVKVD